MNARAGRCALLGLPNAGKSTLLNRLVGTRLVAVSAKPQTTRHRIAGIVPATTSAGEAAQIVFVDTPGMQNGRGPLRRFMRDEALAAARADVGVLVIDAVGRGRYPDAFWEGDAELLKAKLPRELLILLNKADLEAKPNLLPLIEAWSAWRPDAPVIPLSALTGDNTERLTTLIADRLPIGAALYPDEQLTDRSERFLASELIREQLYHQLGRELPYASAVQIEQWDERENGMVAIGAVIIVERASQKPIVVGRGGTRIKALGIAAREALEESMGRKVHLTLFVKVHEGWSQADEELRRLGYVEELP